MTDISSMTDEQLNEALAEWRGWHKRQTGTGYPWYWCEPDYMEDSLYRHSRKSVMMCSEWQPCTDLNQAVECAEMLGRFYKLRYFPSERRYEIEVFGNNVNAYNPARALSEAVLMAVRGERTNERED